MDFKKKWQRFWTLDRHHAEGFTLVELVVVIAIMAILAGVAVPAYTGYVEKSEDAADQVLLEAVNKAFAAACLESEIDSISIKQASVAVEDKVIAGLASVQNNDGSLSSTEMVNIAKSFMVYVAANTDMEFKNEEIRSLNWNVDHFEIDTVNGAVSMVVFSNGNVATLNQAALNAILGSVYVDMGASGVKDMLKTNVDAAKLVLAGSGLASILGISIGNDKIIEEVTSGSFAKYFTPDQQKFISDTLSDRRASSEDKDRARTLVANSAVLYAADALKDKNADTIHTAMTSSTNNPRQTMSAQVATGGMGGTLVTTAMNTALYEAFIKTETGSKYAGNDDIANALKSTDNKDAQNSFLGATWDKYNTEQKAAMDVYDAWLKTDEGKQQLDGFMGAMTIVNDNVGGIGQDAFVEEGLNNVDVNKLLDDVIGAGAEPSVS